MAYPSLSNRGRLLVACPDRPGIIAAISDTLFRLGANIVSSDQYSEDPSQGMFFMRTEFELEDYPAHAARVAAALAPVAERFAMRWRLAAAGERKRLAVFVSREGHCLQELLWQCQTGEIPAQVVLVISNHPDLEEAVRPFGIPFRVIPVSPASKPEAERRAQELLRAAGVDAVVLARYMQILSPAMVEAWRERVINIHHSFLPAFVGSNPYQQAYARGVKLIGATAHYVTGELDAGPIIEQDVQRVDHRHRVEDLRRLGRHVERMVLARAVRWHVEDRVWVHQNRTVVFP